MDLQILIKNLAASFPEYEFTYKKAMGRPVIIVKKDTFRGAEIYSTSEKVQIVPAIPTTKGKLLFGSGIGFAKFFIKNYSIVADTLYSKLMNIPDLEFMLEKISETGEIELTEKGKKSERVVLMILGIATIFLGIYLYFEFQELENNGGEMRLHWILVLLYENLGKEITVAILGALGGYFIYSGIKK